MYVGNRGTFNPLQKLQLVPVSRVLHVYENTRIIFRTHIGDFQQLNSEGGLNQVFTIEAQETEVAHL